ncbi:hypothetical protein BKA62DRAFT_745446 [Auriculariales sp. MPI-PUGE-AT-0066]|nr:hypothetical protein BKA62DRAFT_745446 [Auriculariales sp. MPI-PUGE-AT-0066]
MPKQKSSASSATRKKHARKAAVGKKEKKDKKAPKVKQYIPPSKPAPVKADPLDVGGLAARIDPELLVILRRLGKRDAITKRRALEELSSLATTDRDDWADIATVWGHHLNSLALHPARRVRHLTASTHALLLPHLQDYLDMPNLLGAWCMLAHDADRAVALAARPAWEALGAPLVLGPEGEHDYERETLEAALERAIIQPGSLYGDVFPSAPPVPSNSKGRPGVSSTAASTRTSTPTPGETREGEEEAPADRNARLRVGGLNALGWLVTASHSSRCGRAWPTVLQATELWDGLSSLPLENQPGVRRATWLLLGALLASDASKIAEDVDLLETLSLSVLRNAWKELDAGVKLVMWEPLLIFLSKFSRAWLIEFQDGNEDEEDEASETRPVQSTAFGSFLQFLTLGCNGSAARGYPAVLIILNTIPAQTLGDGSAFFTAVWAALDGRALGTPDATRAFLSCVVECALWAVKKQLAIAPEQFLKEELKGANAAVIGDGLEKLRRMDEGAVAWSAVACVDTAPPPADAGHVIALLQSLAKLPETNDFITALASSALETSNSALLVPLLENTTFRPIIIDDAGFSQQLATAAGEEFTDVRLVLLYLANNQVWNRLLRRSAKDESLLSILLEASRSSNISGVQSLEPDSGVDELFNRLLEEALSNPATTSDVAAKVLANPILFLQHETVSLAHERLTSVMSLTVEATLRDAAVDLAPAGAALRLVTPSFSQPEWSALRVKAFLLSHLTNLEAEVELQGEEERDAALLDLSSALLDVSVLASPTQILSAALAATKNDPAPVLGLLIPQHAELAKLRTAFARSPLPAAWAVAHLDADGRTAYERVLTVIVRLLSDNRDLAKCSAWVIQHLAIAIAVAERGAKHKVDGAEGLLAYMLVAPVDDEGWLTIALDGVLRRILAGAEVRDAESWVKAARAFEKTGNEELLLVDLELMISAVPLAYHALLHALSHTRLEPPLLARVRTELVATLSGIPPSKANAEGLRTLRALNAAAPDQRGDAAVVPQQRAVFLVKTIERWLADDDEEIDPEVECELVELFVHLAPVLQSVPGSHWETILDLLEANLENADLNESEDLLLITRTLRLVHTVLELVASTKMLRIDYWQPREKTMMKFVLRLLEASVQMSDRESAPLAIVKELLVTLATCHFLTSASPIVLQTVYPFLQQAASPATALVPVAPDAEGYSVEPSEPPSSSKASAPEERLEIISQLPSELLALIQVRLETELDDADENPNLLAVRPFLFIPMMSDQSYRLLAFIHLQRQSVKVKSAFMDQLRDLDIIEEYFVPTILGLLGVGPTRKPIKLDMWAVDEFYLSLYESSQALSAKVLAAHLYFRALATVPALIRAWFVKSKDRQLTATVSTFTSSIFSPSLIQTALDPVRSDATPSAENWSLRVPTTSTEAHLSYTVDEQSLEIALKLPLDWPLRGVDVREVRKVGGIPEQKWRAWVFGAQVVAGRGDVLEALSVFKRNVEGHFEGQVECAICYCIISVTDRSMPTKPCRTCKNRFHASCLYKWFKTSHASSCPLCRSDIL